MAVINVMLASGQSVRPERTHLKFRAPAGGAQAYANHSWQLTPGRSMGLAAGAAICGDEVFLVDTANRAVQHFSLPDGRLVGSLGPRGDGTSDLQAPLALAADCDSHMLYVVGRDGVAQVNVESNALIRRFPRPSAFARSVGSAFVDRESRRLYVPGLWMPAAHNWLGERLGNMLEGNRIGWTVDLVTGGSAPMLGSIERGCWSSQPDCVSVRLDRVVPPRREAWVAAHSVSTQVGLFDRDYRLVRTIDVRSPLFLEDGRWHRRSEPFEQRMAWNETNSTIRGVYAFGGNLITIHTRQATRNWKRHEQIDFDVFMNVHSLDGEGIVSDIRLPDLPVARDDENLYVLDYGPGGRRRVGSGPVTLISIPVATNVSIFR